LGFFDSIKKSRKQVNRENQEQGKAGERRIKEEYEFSGYKVKRTGKGHDLKAEKKDWFTGKKETKYIEVKTGNSKLSPLQKKKRGYLGKKYVVERLEPTPFGLVSNNKESDKPKRRKKKDSFGLFGSANLGFWDSDPDTKKKTKKRTTKRKTTKPKSTTKKKSESIWGSSSIDSIFGSSSTKKKTKRKTTKPKSTTKKKSDSIWGSSSSMDSLFGSTTKRKTTKRKSTRKKSTSKKKSTDIRGSSTSRKKSTGIW